MRLHIVPQGFRLAVETEPETEPATRAPISDRVSPDHPSVDRPGAHGGGGEPSDAGTSFSPAPAPSPTEGRLTRITTAAPLTPTPSDLAGTDGRRRPTPYESGLAAVARGDVHIERVWPMRSPPIGALEESSSAYFQDDRCGTPPAGHVPVGGLRMNQAFPHEPVMATEVVDLFGPVPSGLIVDTTLGGGGHAEALLTANPNLRILGLDRDPAAVAAARDTLAPFADRVVIRQSRFDRLDQVVRQVQDELGTPAGERGLAPGDLVCFPSGPDGAHAVRGPGRVVMFSGVATARAASISVYPDSDKLGARPPGRGPDRLDFRRGDAVDYWDGE